MLRIALAMMVVVGILGGTVSDSAPANTPIERGGYKVVEADLHTHSWFGDGILSPFGIVDHARRQGLDAIAITDHNQIFGARFGRWISRNIGGPTVLVGEEITAPAFHMIAVGLNERISWEQSAAEVIEEIHSQGGVAIVAHPRSKFWKDLNDNDGLRILDASEVMHPIALAPGTRWEEMKTFYQRTRASGKSLKAIGSSDYHWFNSLGICRTYVFVHDNNEAGIIEALRAGRTVVYDLEGNAYGEPEMIRLLHANPVERNVGDYDYSGNGPVDLFSRSVGWLGLVGLVLFGRLKRTNSKPR